MDLKQVAPWVVKLEQGSDFTRNLFTRGDAPWYLWDADPGIYVRSRGSGTRAGNGSTSASGKLAGLIASLQPCPRISQGACSPPSRPFMRLPPGPLQRYAAFN